MDKKLYDSYVYAKVDTFSLARNRPHGGPLPVSKQLRCIDTAYAVLKDFESRKAYCEQLIVEYKSIVDHAKFAVLARARAGCPPW